MLKLTCLALFVNSATARRINAIASAVRRSEKARFLCITDGLIGDVQYRDNRENDANDEKTLRHVHEHHSKHEPNYEV